MKTQRKVLFAKFKAKEIVQEALDYYSILRTKKMVDRIPKIEDMIWERDFNECKARAKEWRSTVKRMHRAEQKASTMLLKQLRQRKEFEQELFAY